MKTILLAILGLSFVIVSCAGSKPRMVVQCEQLAKYHETEEKGEPLKRHNRW